MNLWPVEYFFEHIRHHLCVGATASPAKSDDKYAQKNVELVRGSSFHSDFLQKPYFNEYMIVFKQGAMNIRKFIKDKLY